MATIGLQYLVCSPLTATDGVSSYADGIVMSYAIKAEVSIDLNEAILYADNRVVENVKEFKSGKITINGDHLEYETRALLLGHEIINEQDGSKRLIARGGDDGAFVGVGFYATSIREGVRKYRAIWLRKVKFGVPGEALETKGDNITFQTPTIEGTVMTDAEGVWKEEALFDDEADAKGWLNEQAGIDAGDGGDE